jgi:hypothetical protein
MKSRILKIGAGSALALAVTGVLVMPAKAIDFQHNVNSDMAYFFPVDWSATSTVANHPNYELFPTWDHPRGVAVKYLDFDITNDFPGARGHCFDMKTYPGPSGQLADTEILVKKDDGTWARLSDDTPSSRLSQARFYFDDLAITRQYLTSEQFGASPTKIRVAAYGAGNNAEDFVLSFTFVGDLTQAQCFSNTSVAAAYFDRHEYVTIVRAI